jgi:hypothetical protein
MTLQEFLLPVARDHTMPMTVIRGMSSLPPKKGIADRFRASNKAQLILLIVTDLDPAGETIALDLLKSFRRDFAIDDIEAIKVALTIDQVRERNLPPSMEAKEGAGYKDFVAKYGAALTSSTPCSRRI